MVDEGRCATVADGQPSLHAGAHRPQPHPPSLIRFKSMCETRRAHLLAFLSDSTP